MHARLTQRTADTLITELKEQGVSVMQNPDLLVLTYTELAVDDARQISTYAHLKAVGDGKYLIVSFDRAGVEAQNALLKVVEEAPGNSHFYFSTPNLGSVIPTLRSRCIVETQTSDVLRTSDVQHARAFLALRYAERLALIEKLVTQAQRSQDRTPIREFVRALVHAHPSRETLDAVRYLDQNGSSPKLVLSHLAVTLPLLGTRN